jgi:hypothetical protein
VRILREQSIAGRRFENWSFSSLPARAEGPAAAQSPEDFIWHLTRRLK